MMKVKEPQKTTNQNPKMVKIAEMMSLSILMKWWLVSKNPFVCMNQTIKLWTRAISTYGWKITIRYILLRTNMFKHFLISFPISLVPNLMDLRRDKTWVHRLLLLIHSSTAHITRPRCYTKVLMRKLVRERFQIWVSIISKQMGFISKAKYKKLLTTFGLNHKTLMAQKTKYW